MLAIITRNWYVLNLKYRFRSSAKLIKRFRIQSTIFLVLNKGRRHCHWNFVMWSGKINMLLFYVLYDLWFVTSLLHYFSLVLVTSEDTCNIIVFYQSTVTNNTTVIMFSTVRNNAYSEHVMEIMTQGLRKVCKCLKGKLEISFPIFCIYAVSGLFQWCGHQCSLKQEGH